MLRFIAVIYEPVSISFVNICLAKGEFDFPQGRRPGREEVKTCMAELREAGLLNRFNQCPPVLAEELTREAVLDESFAQMAKLVEQEAPVAYGHGKWTTRCWRAVRQYRIGVYSRDLDKMEEASRFLEEHCAKHLDIDPPAVLITALAFDRDWLSSQPGSLLFSLLDQVVRYAVEHLRHFPNVLEYLADGQTLPLSQIEQVPFHRILATYYLLQGNFTAMEEVLNRHAESFQASGFSGTLAFLQGDLELAMASFEEDLARLREFAGAENVFFFGVTGLFCLFALLTRDQEGDRDRVKRSVAIVLASYHGCPEEVPFRFIDAVVRAGDKDIPDMVALTEQLAGDERSLSMVIAVLCLHWMGIEIPDHFKRALEELHQKAQENTFFWLAMETAALLAELEPENRAMTRASDELAARLHCRRLTTIISPDVRWKKSLQELVSLASRTYQSERSVRLAWFVAYGANQLRLSPREQRRTMEGGWSRGRTIALNRLVQPCELDYLSIQDRQVCAALVQKGEPTSRNGGYVFDLDQALPLLVGHPLVFLDRSPQTPVELVRGEPELMVEKQGDELFIHFAQDIGEGEVTVWQETPTRFRIIAIGMDHRKVAAITGRKGLRVPLAASQQVLDAIGNIASFMTVHSSIDVGLETNDADFVEADPEIHIHIIPYGSGFRLEMFVQPFGKRGPYLKPGAGVANLMTEIDGCRLRTRRDLSHEEERAREIEESCPMLDLAIDLEQENKREWHLLEPEECLQALLELDAVRDRIQLEWPEGEKLSVRRQAGVNQLNLNIRTSQQDWFALSGHLEIDQDEVMELKTLLENVRTSGSRFIPLGDGQFIALTQEFRQRLDDLIAYGQRVKNEDDVHIHPLAAVALEELTRAANTRADRGWQQQLDAVARVQDMVPEVPTTLKADLRDYQFDGFVWMARLAELGIGACLADDMGLGKTLQGIAVILRYADRGPCLVVAPTSVCMNWESEITRFAPTFRFHLLSSSNRDEVVQRLGKFDILVTSYTLLQQEIELLAGVQWQCVILDEAQAIKNAATKRSKAAMRLKARFRLITTGTPIENHLGELWNLFRFINPGLLGSFRQFNSRFGIPIEKHHDRDARRKLKKLIRPFILRRIKAQVLDELPPRTEITLQVEMTSREMEFYEALRQQAIENIESSAEQSGRHLRILAEIMRLRRACCNPRLIDNTLAIPSAKLKVFAGIIEELLQSRHKALVFSQFTGHLTLIREYLDGKGLSYKYLDGTTPARERQLQVEGFQAGEGDLFLISLKAGGLGLNLTAADYVIHMDPWWNPAVEDQAADRVHRIGQTRPVTVYRLVTVKTIEEKIVRLHKEKRELANSLLKGADVSARISSEYLLELIRSA
ncbi:MAG: helicase [Desulfobulbus propionicus]|nr:MAG: helicase [Desulfobulbus propionicus]